jgi:microcystin-dependent protein
MSEPFLGEIRRFSFGFTPRGWLQCNGQLLPINQNQALFALLGTQYGGNGTTTFALPDLRGRMPIHRGQRPNLSQRTQGQQGGSETLTASQLPAHSHTLNASSAAASTNSPGGNVLATSRLSIYAPASGTPVSMSSQAITGGGPSSPTPAMPPYLVLNYCIAVQGIFPSPN